MNINQLYDELLNYISVDKCTCNHPNHYVMYGKIIKYVNHPIIASNITCDILSRYGIVNDQLLPPLVNIILLGIKIDRMMETDWGCKSP